MSSQTSGTMSLTFKTSTKKLFTIKVPLFYYLIVAVKYLAGKQSKTKATTLTPCITESSCQMGKTFLSLTKMMYCMRKIKSNQTKSNQTKNCLARHIKPSHKGVIKPSREGLSKTKGLSKPLKQLLNMPKHSS